MADISQSRSSLEALRGVLNRERVEEIKEGQGMRKVFKAAETALEAYAKAKDELRFADAGSLSEKAAEAVETAWSHYRKLEVGWAFDQVAKLQTSLDSLVNTKRHAFFSIRRFFYADLRQTFQTAGDKLAFIKTWKGETGKSDVLRQHVREAWDAANGAWDTNSAIEKAGGLPGSWLFRAPVLDVLNSEAKRLAKAADDIIKAQASAEGKPAPAKIKAREYTWEVVVAMDEADFQLALPIGDAAAMTRERITAQRDLAVKLDAKGQKVETLYAAYKASKLVANGNGLTEADVALITARFVAMETPKDERRKPATSPEAQAAADLKADAAAGNSIAAALVKLDDRKNGKDATAPADESEWSLEHSGFRGWIIAEAEKLNVSTDDALNRAAANLVAARAGYKQFLTGGNGNGKKSDPKRKQKDEGKAAAEEKNEKNPKPRARRSRQAVAEAED